MGTGGQPVERGTAEDEVGVAANQIEVDASRVPPIISENEGDSVVEDDGSGMAGGSSGSSSGGSGTPGHPDATR